MILKETVSQIVSSYLDGTDYYITHINVSPDNRIVVEIDAFDGVSLDFCIELNKHIESQFDREVEDFELEVSSAGLTEPFRVLKQYEKNIGNEVEVLTKSGVKIAGILVAAIEENFTISREVKVQVEGSKRKVVVDEKSTFNYNEIKYTKYIIRFK